MDVCVFLIFRTNIVYIKFSTIKKKSIAIFRHKLLIKFFSEFNLQRASPIHEIS